MIPQFCFAEAEGDTKKRLERLDRISAARFMPGAIVQRRAQALWATRDIYEPPKTSNRHMFCATIAADAFAARDLVAPVHWGADGLQYCAQYLVMVAVLVPAILCSVLEATVGALLVGVLSGVATAWAGKVKDTGIQSGELSMAIGWVLVIVAAQAIAIVTGMFQLLIGGLAMGVGGAVGAMHGAGKLLASTLSAPQPEMPRLGA